MVSLETKKAFYEVLIILKYMDGELTSLISPTVLKGLKDNCAKDYDFEFNPYVSLERQNISKQALSILSLFDLVYWAKRRRQERSYKTIWHKSKVK